MRVALGAALLALAACAPAAAAAAPEDLVIASGFDAPTAMAVAPDGRVFVAEQGGRVRVVKDGSLLAEPFLEVAEDSRQERGLLGVTFDPAYASNRYVYVYYTRASPVVNRLSRFTASASDPDVAEAGSETVLLDNIPSSHYHNGGAIHFGPDGRLYVAVGDGLVSTNSQSLSSLSGKLLRIDADGGIPADNPFFQSTSGVYRAIWARGLRNPFTFDVEDATGRIFINDVGENTHEEIDEAWSGPPDGSNAGFNFGWPATEGPTTDPAFKTPFYAYGHGDECAITGGAFYDPAVVNFPSASVGDYFFADYCAGWVKGIDLATKQVSTLVAPDGARSPVDVKVSEDGSLYYLAHSGGGTSALHRVRYVGAGVPPSVVGNPQDTTDPEGGALTYTWRVDFHHESHTHPFLPAAEGADHGSFPVPTRGETSPEVWYRIHLTVTDGAKLTASAYRDVLPRTASLRLGVNVPGLSLELDGQPGPAPRAVRGVVGLERAIAAPSPQTVGGRTYEFVAWSDGGGRSHAIATPASDTTYTATFRELTSAPPGASAPAVNALLPSVGTPLPAPRLSVRAPGRMTWANARRRGIPVRVRGVAGARVRAVVRAGRRRLGARSLRVGPGGSRRFRLRLRRGTAERRRRVRLDVAAVMPDGRRLATARRIVLLPRRRAGG